MSQLKEIRTTDAPAPVGPYSQAVQAGEWIFVSGQIPLDPETSTLVSEDLSEQAVRVFENLRAVLEAAGSSFDQIVKTTVYMTNLADFPTVNEIYARYFSGDPKPARATVQVAALPLGVQIEIDAIARK